MRRTAPFVAALAALLIAAPSALAHHVSGGRLACYINSSGNVVIGVTTNYASFADSNKPVGRTDYVDSHPHAVPAFTWSGPDFTKTVWIGSTPGSHYVKSVSTWPGQGDENATFSGNVTCPVPPVPTPTPPPAPPRIVPPPPALPTPPVPPARPHVVRVHASINYLNRDPQQAGGVRARIVVEHPGMRHGLQTFRLEVRGGTVIHSSVRWYVRGKRVRQRHWTYVVRGVILRSWLFDGPPMVNGGVWSRPGVYGRYRVSVSARVRVPAKAKASRSSWT